MLNVGFFLDEWLGRDNFHFTMKCFWIFTRKMLSSLPRRMIKTFHWKVANYFIYEFLESSASTTLETYQSNPLFVSTSSLSFLFLPLLQSLSINLWRALLKLLINYNCLKSYSFNSENLKSFQIIKISSYS